MSEQLIMITVVNGIINETEIGDPLDAIDIIANTSTGLSDWALIGLHTVDVGVMGPDIKPYIKRRMKHME